MTYTKLDRIQSIINASQLRGDALPTDLESEIRKNKEYKIACHRSCVSTYTSKCKIDRYLKSRQRSVSEPIPLKRSRRSDSDPEFSFQTHCIFCGKECIETPDPKNPGRWRPVSRCRTVESVSSSQTFKDAILQTCKGRNDKLAKEVELRILGAHTDLHAADARYHRDCRPSFMGAKSQPSSAAAGKDLSDEAFEKVIRAMESDRDRMWSSVELHNLYTENNGIQFQRRNLVEAISDHFGENILLCHVRDWPACLCVGPVLVNLYSWLRILMIFP